MKISFHLRIICFLVLLFSGIVFASYGDYVRDLRRLSRGRPSLDAGNKVAHFNEALKYAEEVSTIYFENDLLSPKDYTKHWKWPNGIVYYAFSNTETDAQKFLIREAMNAIESRTPAVKFIPRDDQDDYILFDNKKTGCWSALGRVGGQQVLNLQHPQCFWFDRTATHMLLHALGLAHENNRHDRDDYISIEPGNIIQTFEKYFVKKMDHMFNTPYNLVSIMHFSSKTNSDNERDVINSKDSNILNSEIGRTLYPQASDAAKLEEIYN